jgi:hypothetical protein
MPALVRADQGVGDGRVSAMHGATTGCYERTIRLHTPEWARAWCSRRPTCSALRGYGVTRSTQRCAPTLAPFGKRDSVMPPSLELGLTLDAGRKIGRVMRRAIQKTTLPPRRNSRTSEIHRSRSQVGFNKSLRR